MNLNQEQANKLARVLLEANAVEELSDRMLAVFGKVEQQEKQPKVSHLRYRGTDRVEIAEPHKRCPVDGEIWLCGPGAIGFGVWCNPVWILRVVELEVPPDVSGMEFEGMRVEIAEPKKRESVPDDIVLAENIHGKYLYPLRVRMGVRDGYVRWILRTVPLSVYGCDPKSVDLSSLRGPNGFPVELVEHEWFRLPKNGDLVVLSDRQVCKTYFNWDQKGFAEDQRRIIVREVKPKPKARQWIATECLNQLKGHCGHRHMDTGADAYKGSSTWATVATLADLDDPEVLNVIHRAVSNAYSQNTKFQDLGLAAIRAYLEINPTK